LEIQIQFSGSHRLGEIARQVSAARHFAFQIVVEQPVSASSRFLYLVQGGIGVAQKQIGVAIGLPRKRDPDARSDLDLISRHREREAKPRHDFAGDTVCFVRVGPGLEQQGEFVASQSGKKIAVSRQQSQSL